MKARAVRSEWVLYALGVLATLVALGWTGQRMLALDRAESSLIEENHRHELIRLALWRMDSWFGPQLATEIARLPVEYKPYSPQDEAYTKILSKIEPGGVLVPSPLLSFRSPIILVHFQVDGRGNWMSPQVPTGNLLDLAEATGLVDEASLERNGAALATLANLVDLGGLQERCGGAERNLNRLLQNGLALAPTPSSQEVEAQGQSLLPPTANAKFNIQERTWRAQNLQQGQNIGESLKGVGTDPALRSTDPSHSSPLVPLWLEGEAGVQHLCFVRRARVDGGVVFQGFLADWEELSSALAALVADLVPEGRLEPELTAAPDDDLEGTLLATIPATLAGVPLEAPHASPWSTASLALLITWLVTLAALGAVGLSLRSSIRYGEERSRFASTVTHELRTPLTTFRLYSEMLAKGLVPEEKRPEYLETLERESNRLAILVENVLAYSRLEEGRIRLRPERVAAAALLERMLPSLERRALEGGMDLRVDLEAISGVTLETDPEAVERILFNLIDNACKYGREGQGGRIEFSAEAVGDTLWLRVLDHGRGVPRGSETAIFQAFDRGELDAADPNPGVGLGLALSRGLARDLGGDLTLESSSSSGGASFRLSLPGAPTTP